VHRGRGVRELDKQGHRRLRHTRKAQRVRLAEQAAIRLMSWIMLFSSECRQAERRIGSLTPMADPRLIIRLE
jgi:hypothetical protein